MMHERLSVKKMAECMMEEESQLNGLAKMTVTRGELPREDRDHGVQDDREAQADSEDAVAAEASDETGVETDMGHLRRERVGAEIVTLQTEDPCHGHPRETDTDPGAGVPGDIRAANHCTTPVYKV